MAGRNFIIKKDSLIDLNTGTEVIKYSGEENKYFAAVVMSGHCGNLFYVPIMHSFLCRDIDEAISLAKNVARVKRNYKDCVLCIGEIDQTSYRLIELLNKFDGYLKHADEGFDDSDIEDRKIISPLFMQMLLENKTKALRRRDNLNFKHIRTADMYPEDLVLQRMFAPRVRRTYTNNKEEEIVEYIFPKKVKLRDFLDDYLTAETFNKAVKKNNLSAMAMYYHLYGPNNRLNIVYKDGNIEYINTEGQKVVREVREPMRKYLEDEQVGFKSKVSHQLFNEEFLASVGEKSKAKTGVDRFKERMKKTEEYNKNGYQPGEE